MRPRSSVLIVVENLTMPLDRRVWQEAVTLRDAGYVVSVICPKGAEHTGSYELLEGIHVFRHPAPFEATGKWGYALEYSWALAWEFALSIKVWFKVGFDVIQACNPPDTIFLLAGFHKLLFGKRFVFDQHDINPELYEAKFGRRGFLHKLLTRLERWTFQTADVSIATNDTFKSIAIGRGGMDPDRVFVVRSVPDAGRFRRTRPDAALKNGRKHLIGYVGIMGAQDGVNLLIDAMDDLVNRQGRRDVQCAVVGSGTDVERLRQLSRARGLADYVTFTGLLSGAPLLRAMSAFDIGAIPDPKNSYNDKISMNKLFEYMAMGIPFVQFDLLEGRRAAGDAALYAENNCPHDMAAKFAALLDAPDLRQVLSQRGRQRSADLLRWDNERAQLLAAYDMALGAAVAGIPAGEQPAPA